MQVRMYLFGLSSALTPLVATENPATLAATIARARTVETGYNYAPSGLAAQSTTQNMEVDELTRKIEQLSINLAAIANQPTQRPFRRSENRSNQRPQTQQYNRQREDRTCYNCNKTGHIARNCRVPKRFKDKHSLI